MHRREFIAGLGSGLAWPLAALAQPTERTRKVGFLYAGPEGDYQVHVAAFQDRLSELGWIEGRNVQLDVRIGIGGSEQMRAHVAELLSLAPDVMVTASTAATKAVRQQNQTVPIVFTTVNDPVSGGLVQNLAHPQSNATGFANYEPSIAGKWLQLLKEVAPLITRVALVFDPANAPETYIPSIEAAGHFLAVQLVKMPIRNAADVERGIDKFAAGSDGGLLVLPDNTAGMHRDLIIQLAEQHRLPAIYGFRHFVSSGGLMAYTDDLREQFRGAASYVDRILRGVKLSELPVQFPTKYEVVINLKAAKAIDLSIPVPFLLLADEVI
jgi:putative ABC transport system substrate-binding protein